MAFDTEMMTLDQLKAWLNKTGVLLPRIPKYFGECLYVACPYIGLTKVSKVKRKKLYTVEKITL